MAVARVTEVISGSPESFDVAVREGIARAAETLDNVTGAWIKDQQVIVDKGAVVEYRVTLKITFVLKD